MDQFDCIVLDPCQIDDELLVLWVKGNTNEEILNTKLKDKTSQNVTHLFSKYINYNIYIFKCLEKYIKLGLFSISTIDVFGLSKSDKMLFSRRYTNYVRYFTFDFEFVREVFGKQPSDLLIKKVEEEISQKSKLPYAACKRQVSFIISQKISIILLAHTKKM
jgi:hypothetical protein